MILLLSPSHHNLIPFHTNQEAVTWIDSKFGSNNCTLRIRWRNELNSIAKSAHDVDTFSYYI